MVGAVIVRGDAIVGEGHHAVYGGPHAEVVALRTAGVEARGATLYVTLEPCAHQGKTPPCAEAIIDAGVRRVVIATRDPHPIARGGAERLRARGLEVTIGIEERAARELNAPFLHALTSDRPWVTLKLAVSIDGAVNDASRTAGWFTGEAGRRATHRLRAGVDAVAVGIGTVAQDDPLLTVRDHPPPFRPPLRVVFDRHARLPLTSRLVRSADQGPVLVVVHEAPRDRIDALQGAGVAVLDASSVDDALRQLRERGVRALLLEGGPRIAGAFLGASAVDRLVIFQAPVVLGAGAVPAFGYAPPMVTATPHRLPVVEHQAVGDTWMTVYALSEI
jgi:diaminohydroxyphosphoribosylaminopyrimidine deaminase/5-amino-6-(5-phosphoribosylamino)uracil reductase